MVRQRIHTGCSCFMCKAGSNPKIRRAFHKKVRRRHKLQLQKDGEIRDVDLSIGWTD